MHTAPVFGKEILYLTRDDVIKTNLTMAECIDIMEKVYTEKGNDTVIFPPKCPMHPGKDQAITAMPGLLYGMKISGTKFISGFSSNYEKGLPYIHGLYMLMDIEMGIPLAVMDCVEITAIRTGAVTGLGARYMANKDSKTVLFCGAGVQGRMGLDAYMCELPALRKVYITDISKAAEERYVKEMGAKYPGLEIVPVTDLEAAVRDSDILNSCIPSSVNPELKVIYKEWLKPNVTIMPVDGGATYQQDVMARELFSRTYTDDISQLHYFQSIGEMVLAEKNPIELGAVVAGKAPGRLNHEERILTLFSGTGLADLGTAKYIYDNALAQGIGMTLPL